MKFAQNQARLLRDSLFVDGIDASERGAEGRPTVQSDVEISSAVRQRRDEEKERGEEEDEGSRERARSQPQRAVATFTFDNHARLSFHFSI